MERGPNLNLAMVVLSVFRNFLILVFNFHQILNFVAWKQFHFICGEPTHNAVEHCVSWMNGIPWRGLYSATSPAMQSAAFTRRPKTKPIVLLPQKKEREKTFVRSSLSLRTNTKNAVGSWHQQSPFSLSFDRTTEEDGGEKKKDWPFLFSFGKRLQSDKKTAQMGKTDEGGWLSKFLVLSSYPTPFYSSFFCRFLFFLLVSPSQEQLIMSCSSFPALFARAERKWKQERNTSSWVRFNGTVA